jgi:hypothetical protein
VGGIRRPQGQRASPGAGSKANSRTRSGSRSGVGSGGGLTSGSSPARDLGALCTQRLAQTRLNSPQPGQLHSTCPPEQSLTPPNLRTRVSNLNPLTVVIMFGRHTHFCRDFNNVYTLR